MCLLRRVCVLLVVAMLTCLAASGRILSDQVALNGPDIWGAVGLPGEI